MNNKDYIFIGCPLSALAGGAFCVSNNKGENMKSYLIFYRSSDGIKYYTGAGNFERGFSSAWHFTIDNVRVAFRELKSELNIFNLDIMEIDF
jgi:hypothetical protein